MINQVNLTTLPAVQNKENRGVNTQKSTGEQASFNGTQAIYKNEALPAKMRDAFKSNAISFGNNDSGREGAYITIDPKSGFDAREFCDMLALMTDDNIPLIKGLIQKTRPLPGFKGSHIIRIVKAVLKDPEKEPFVDKMISAFSGEKTDYVFVRNLAEFMETFNPDNKNHRRVVDLTLGKLNMNSVSDITDILESINDKNSEMIIKVLHNVHPKEPVNGIEIRLIAEEALKGPEKTQLMKKLFNAFQGDSNCLSGILGILEACEPGNKAKEEVLDVLLSGHKGLWGLVMAQVIEKVTPENKEKIKEAIQKAPGEGMEAAKYIIAIVNKS